MSRNLPAIAAAGVNDLLAFFGFPAANLAGVALAGFLQRRLELAREILMAELTAGKVLPADMAESDEVIGVLFRYARAAEEGAARSNLRLLSRVIKGQYERSCLYASSFSRYAELLSTLRREEIAILGAFHRLSLAPDVVAREENGRANALFEAVRAELVPSMIATDDQFMIFVVATNRTGLLLPVSVWGGQRYWPSELLNETAVLAELATFEI